MSNLKWTKVYDLTVHKKTFRVMVSEHENDGFYAGCLWYDGDRLLKAPGEAGGLTLHVEQRRAPTEDEAIEQILQWATEKFGAFSSFEPFLPRV